MSDPHLPPAQSTECHLQAFPGHHQGLQNLPGQPLPKPIFEKSLLKSIKKKKKIPVKFTLNQNKQTLLVSFPEEIPAGVQSEPEAAVVPLATLLLI